MTNRILNRWTGAVIAESDSHSIRELILLHTADLRSANLSGADLSGADLSGADLSGADLSGADLSDANLSDANLRSADLSGADLSDANLRSADLSDAVGLKHACDYLTQFEQDELGIIVYKRIGAGTTFSIPNYWVVAPGSFLVENANPERGTECGCGVNFGTKDWCSNNYTSADLWKCRIRFVDVCDIVVPYHTDGKARCHRLELLEIVK